MGYDFSVLPANNNFAAWKSPIEDQINKYCGSGSLKFPRSKLQWGKSIFSTLSNSESTGRMYDYLNPESSAGLRPWTNLNWWMILIFSLAISVLVEAIVVAALAARKRSKIGVAYKPFFDKANSQGKVRVNPRGPSLFLGLTCVTTVVGLIFAIFTMIANIQMTVGVKETQCNLWLEVYGHYFGGSQIASSDNLPGRIARNWQGSQPLLTKLTTLEPTLMPSEENPLYIGLSKAKEPVLATAKANYGLILREFESLATKTDEIVTASTPGLAELQKKVTGLKLDTPSLAYLTAKLEYMQGLLGDILQRGGLQIDALIEQYVGPKSIMMHKAYNSLRDAKNIIMQIDVAIAKVVKMWIKLSKKLKGAAITSAVFGLICTSVCIISLIWLAYLSYTTKSKYQTPQVRRNRKSYLTIYAVFLVTSGIYLVLLSLNLLSAAVGSDMCNIADDQLFTQGLWGVFGDDVLRPMGAETTIDMHAVLDTCVKESGAGDVSSVMGLDLRIQELQQDVDDALEVVMKAKDQLLMQKSVHAHFRELEYWMRPLLTTFQARSGSDRPLIGAANPQLVDYSQGDDWNAFYGMVEASSIADILGLSLWYKRIGVADAVDYYNNLTVAVNEFYEQTGVAKRLTPICGPYATATGSTCGSVPDAFQVTPDADFDTYVTAQTDAAGPLDQAKGAFDTIIEANLTTWKIRVPTTARQIISMELMSFWNDWVSGVMPTWVNCDEDPCPLIKARELAADAIATHVKNGFNAQTDTEFAIDGYLSNIVIPKMTELATIADGLTDTANCQFEGTAIRHGVVGSLCDVLFPGTALAGVWSFFSWMAFAIAAYITRYWMHLADVASNGDIDVEAEEQPKQSPGFSYLTQEPEAAAQPAVHAQRDDTAEWVEP